MKTRQKALFAAVFAAGFALVTTLAVAQEHGAANAHGTAEGGAQSGEAREGAEAHGGHHALKDLNWFDIWDKERPSILSLCINFGILFGGYYWLGKKPIAEALKQRRVTIGKDIEDAQKMLAEAKERAKKYQADLKNADADAETAKSALVTAGKGEVERMLREADERAERMKRDATRLLEQEQKQIEQDLRREAVELAVNEATQILSRSATAEDHMRLANDLLEDLAKKPGVARASVRPGAPS